MVDQLRGEKIVWCSQSPKLACHVKDDSSQRRMYSRHTYPHAVSNYGRAVFSATLADSSSKICAESFTDFIVCCTEFTLVWITSGDRKSLALLPTHWQHMGQVAHRINKQKKKKNTHVVCKSPPSQKPLRASRRVLGNPAMHHGSTMGIAY